MTDETEDDISLDVQLMSDASDNGPVFALFVVIAVVLVGAGAFFGIFA